MVLSSVDVLVSLNELAAHVAEWDELSQNASDPNPFFESWFLLPYLQHLGKGCEHFFLVRDANRRLVGFFPFVEERSYRGLPLKFLNVLKTPYIFVTSPLIKKGYETYFWDQTKEWLSTTDKTTLGLQISELKNETDVFTTLQQSGNISDTYDEYFRAVLKTGLSYQQHSERALSSKHRKDLEKKRVKFQDDLLGPIDFTIHSQDLSEISPDFVKLEGSGWKGKRGTSISSDMHLHEFFNEITKRGAAAQKVEIAVLRSKTDLLAAMVVLKTNAMLFGFKTAYNENYEKFSPGMLLTQNLTQSILDSPNFLGMDSCSAPNSPVFSRLWHEEQKVATVLLGTGSFFSRLIVAIIKAARVLRRSIRREKCEKVS